MATENKTHQEVDPEVKIETALSKTELFIQKNVKTIVIAVCAVVVIVGGYFSYQHFYVAPQSLKASDAMFQAQAKFEIDSFEMAINGNSSFMGFKDIAKEYSNTPQGNLANHYTGVSYLKMGKFQDAIDYLTKFKSEGSAVGEIISAQNLGLTGDAYSELGKFDDALKFYDKASSESKNDATAPLYLKKAAGVLFHQGKFQDALAKYQQIKSQYPASFVAQDIDKLIAITQLQM